jgi:hypothetical protein
MQTLRREDYLNRPKLDFTDAYSSLRFERHS